MKQPVFWFVIGATLFATVPTSAQSTGGLTSSDAASILNTMPPNLYNKLQQLSQLLDQSIKTGELTEAQIQQQLMSGQFEQTIRSLSPEANQLFEEITTDMRNGKGPSEDALMPLLGGLTGTGKQQ
jgi:hypothetical protein